MTVSDDGKIALDLYSKMYAEHATQARQHETLRGTISTILASLSGAIVGFYGSTCNSSSHISPWFVGGALAAIGFVGAVLSYKHYERNRLHTEIMEAYRKRMDRILPRTFSTSGPNDSARARHGYPVFGRIRAHYLWLVLFLLIGVVGMLIGMRII